MNTNPNQLGVINPHAAGVDVGSEKMHVSIAGDQPRVFGTFTEELRQLRDWLKENHVASVAMEATGVYWMPLYQILEEAGMEVVLVNGRHVKNVPGRKTDMQDCQWLATLHAHGLLRASFVPAAAIRRLRDYQRLRQDHLTMGASHIQHMQQALERMNVKVHDVLSQLSGASGMRVVHAILKGQRDPEKLADLCDVQVLARKRDRLIESLRGTWEEEHLFALRQALAGWDFYQQQIIECDAQIRQQLRALADSQPPPPDPPKDAPTSKPTKAVKHNAPQIADLNEMLKRLCGGQDLSRLPTLTDYTALQLISETGADLSRWPTAKRFVAWLGLAPGSRQSGKRKKSERMGKGRAGRIFCVVARTLGRSKYLALTGFYRRLRATRGGPVAVVACARKVAILYYLTLTKGLKYVEEGLAKYEERFKEQHLRRLERAARRIGFKLVASA